MFFRMDQFGVANQNLPQKYEPVELENADFEFSYNVYSNDQVEARYILTPKFMERVLEFHNLLWVGNFQMAFDEGGIHITLHYEDDFLFTGGEYKVNDPKFIKVYIENVALLFDIVEKLALDLDTKI